MWLQDECGPTEPVKEKIKKPRTAGRGGEGNGPGQKEEESVASSTCRLLLMH